VAAFVATVLKGAIVALLLRYVMQTGAYPYGSLMLAFSVMAAASESFTSSWQASNPGYGR
jgi:hypothetical protein